MSAQTRTRAGGTKTPHSASRALMAARGGALAGDGGLGGLRVRWGGLTEWAECSGLDSSECHGQVFSR